MAQDGLEYWEGYAFHATLPVEVAIHHAWNRTGATLLDITWTKGQESQNLYFGVSVTRAVLSRLQIELAVGSEPYAGPVAFMSWALQDRSDAGEVFMAGPHSAPLGNGRWSRSREAKRRLVVQEARVAGNELWWHPLLDFTRRCSNTSLGNATSSVPSGLS